MVLDWIVLYGTGLDRISVCVVLVWILLVLYGTGLDDIIVGYWTGLDSKSIARHGETDGLDSVSIARYCKADWIGYCELCVVL